jgi:hypothetical protein
MEVTTMLAEKFFLLLETLKSRTYPDGSPRVVSTSPHIPIKLPTAKQQGRLGDPGPAVNTDGSRSHGPQPARPNR